MTELWVGQGGPVSVGARLYAWRGERQLGVVVKATYALDRSLPMRVLPPLPWRPGSLSREDGAAYGTHEIVHAGDEPFPLPKCEIVISQSIGPDLKSRVPEGTVGLTVSRGTDTLIDKRMLGVDVLLGTQLRPVASDAQEIEPPFPWFGPLAPELTVRRRFRGRFDTKLLRGTSEVVLPPAFNEGFFQSAPPDQQLGQLRGGDCITLLGMGGAAPPLKSIVSDDPGVALIAIADQAPRRLRLRLDRVHLDPAASIAELSFRTMVPVVGDASKIRVQGGLEMTGRPWSTTIDAVHYARVEQLGRAIPEATPSPRRGGGTMVLEQDQPALSTVVVNMPHALSGTMPIPLTTPAAEPQKRDWSETLVENPLADQKPPSSMPFVRKPPSARTARSASQPIPGAPWDSAIATPAPPIISASSPDEAAPVTVVLGADAPRDVEPTAATQRAPEPPPAPPATSPSTEPAPSARPSRKKVSADPWRKDPAPPAEPPPKPPPAPGTATRADVSGGLYKRFKK